MPDLYVSPVEQRRYRNGDETIIADVQIRPTVSGEGRLYVDVTVEALELILARAGFERVT